MGEEEARCRCWVLIRVVAAQPIREMTGTDPRTSAPDAAVQAAIAPPHNSDHWVQGWRVKRPGARLDHDEGASSFLLAPAASPLSPSTAQGAPSESDKTQWDKSSSSWASRDIMRFVRAGARGSGGGSRARSGGGEGVAVGAGNGRRMCFKCGQVHHYRSKCPTPLAAAAETPDSAPDSSITLVPPQSPPAPAPPAAASLNLPHDELIGAGQEDVAMTGGAMTDGAMTDGA